MKIEFEDDYEAKDVDYIECHGIQTKIYRHGHWAGSWYIPIKSITKR
jgi:hypothetical protein